MLFYSGPKHRQRFLCELRVNGFDYVGAGNSTTKKDAQGNACRDYVNYLIRSGLVNPNDVPADVGFASAGGPPPIQAMPQEASLGPPPLMQQKAVFSDGLGPNDIGRAYCPTGGQESYLQRLAADQRRVEDAEDVDVNAGIHGNWTIENAKSKLHQFMQISKINADYKYSQVGSDHTRYELCGSTSLNGIAGLLLFLFLKIV